VTRIDWPEPALRPSPLSRPLLPHRRIAQHLNKRSAHHRPRLKPVLLSRHCAVPSRQRHPAHSLIRPSIRRVHKSLQSPPANRPAWRSTPANPAWYSDAIFITGGYGVHGGGNPFQLIVKAVFVKAIALTRGPAILAITNGQYFTGNSPVLIK
jgi:hypothetical protein